MLKILLVSYTPRFDSNTNKLVQTFLQYAKEKYHITHLNLAETPVPLLLKDNLNILIKRNFTDIELSADELHTLDKEDQILQQLLDADRIVIAFPMYNFSLPATVKAWIDIIVQNGRTFQLTDQGEYLGLCQNKKALILMTTGGDFNQEPIKSMNHATTLLQCCMHFIGIESHCIMAYGLDQYMDRATDIVSQAQQEISNYLKTHPSWKV